jgi:endonuclease-3
MGDGGAYRMLLFAGDHPILPVDSKVTRVGRRLGYGAAKPSAARTTRTIRDALVQELAADIETYRRATVYLDHHAVATCAETDPHCHVCPLIKECPEGRKRMTQGSRV